MTIYFQTTEIILPEKNGCIGRWHHVLRYTPLCSFLSINPTLSSLYPKSPEIYLLYYYPSPRRVWLLPKVAQTSTCFVLGNRETLGLIRWACCSSLQAAPDRSPYAHPIGQILWKDRGHPQTTKNPRETTCHSGALLDHSPGYKNGQKSNLGALLVIEAASGPRVLQGQSIRMPQSSASCSSLFQTTLGLVLQWPFDDGLQEANTLFWVLCQVGLFFLGTPLTLKGKGSPCV